MRRLIVCLLTVNLCALAGAAAWAAEEKPVPTMPSEVTLTSGRVLRNVQVIRWESNRVVLKHSAGADPIAFSLFKVPAPGELQAIKETSIQALKKEAAEKQIIAMEAVAPKSYDGQIFIVTRGAGNYMLGATTIRVYFKPRNEVYDAFKWSIEAPTPDEVAVSDAEGKFSFKAPRSGPVTLVAKGRRLVGRNINYDYEYYLWIVSVDTMANRFQPLLTNGNMESGPISQSRAYESL